MAEAGNLGDDVVLRVPAELRRWRGLKGNAYRAAVELWNAAGCEAGVEVLVSWADLAGEILPDANRDSVRRTVLSLLVDEYGLAELVERLPGGARLRLIHPREAWAAYRRLRLAETPRQQAFEFMHESLADPAPRASAGLSGVQVVDRGSSPISAPAVSATDSVSAARQSRRLAGQNRLAKQVANPLSRDASSSDEAVLRRMVERQRAEEGPGRLDFGARLADIQSLYPISGYQGSASSEAAGGPQPLVFGGRSWRTAEEYARELHRQLVGLGCRSLHYGVVRVAARAVELGILPWRDVERIYETTERLHVHQNGRSGDPGAYFVKALKTRLVERESSYDAVKAG